MPSSTASSTSPAHSAPTMSPTTFQLTFELRSDGGTPMPSCGMAFILLPHIMTLCTYSQMQVAQKALGEFLVQNGFQAIFLGAFINVTSNLKSCMQYSRPFSGGVTNGNTSMFYPIFTIRLMFECLKMTSIGHHMSWESFT